MFVAVDFICLRERDVLTGEPFEVSDATVVAPKTALVVEYKR